MASQYVTPGPLGWSGGPPVNAFRSAIQRLAELDDWADCFGLLDTPTRAAWLHMAARDLDGRPATMGSLQDAARLSKHLAVKLVRRAVAQGLLSLAKGRLDSRRAELTLTPNGRQFIASALESLIAERILSLPPPGRNG